MKTPPQQFTDEQAHTLTEEFIRGDQVVPAGGDRVPRERFELQDASVPATRENGEALGRDGNRRKRVRVK